MDSFIVPRHILADKMWGEEVFTKGQASIDLISMAATQDCTVLVKGREVRLVIGQMALSTRELEKKWKWSRGKIDLFIKEMESRGYFTLTRNEVTTVLTFNLRLTTQKKTNNQPKGKQEKLFDEPEKTTKLQEYIKKNYPNISKIKHQLTFAQAEEIQKSHKPEFVKLILDDMENYPPLVKKNFYVHKAIAKFIRNHNNWNNNNPPTDTTPTGARPDQKEL